jgi:hypothetical protein
MKGGVYMAILLFIIFVIIVGCWAYDAWQLTKIEYEEDTKNKNRRSMNIDIK